MGKLDDFSTYSYVYMLHNSCNPRGLMLRFMSSMHLYTCKCLLNTLGRAVQQLAECLAKETKGSTRGQSTTTCNVYPLMNI